MDSTSEFTDAIKILVVEDDTNLREALSDTLQLADYDVIAANSAEDALKKLAEYDDLRMIISDVNMGAMSGHDLLREVKANYPHIPMMLITAYASISQSVDAIKNGAVDYLVKPFAPNVLVETMARHLGVAQIQGDEPIAHASSSRQLLQLAQRVAQSESTVLIVGESGTGKEVLARYIHNHSPRANQPFIAINCAAIPENMLEAMLFGHEKGAYTGAHSSAPGKFEQANGGTLLLDEISEMDIGLQAKLLRVLQEREVERLGGRKTIKLDVRVIATSNRDMREQVVAGKFREDLYYRLSVLPLQWAPLRDRLEDIVPLAQKILQKHAKKQNRHGANLTMSAQQALLSYSWPGNVRELDNIMQRALILQTGNSIDAVDLGLDAGNI
ncbi:MAG: sigma-54-dependent Fis family transcriptional regulator, partial [Moraxellaceae bacterium]